MEAQFDDELRLLANALRQETFRFILIGHNRYSLYSDISNWLKNKFAGRPFLELHLRDKDYRQIVDELVHFHRGIVLIPDFDWLLLNGNETVTVAFNQRRDAFARLDIALLCFVEPASYRRVPEKLPDWWSLRSLELDFYRETPEKTFDFDYTRTEISSLGGESKEEKEAEIKRLLRQLEVVDPDNKTLRQSLYDQLGSLSFQLSSYEAAQQYWQKSLGISREIGDRSGEGVSLSNISQIYKVGGDYQTALSYLQQSLSIMQQTSDKKEEGAALNNISQIYQAWGDYQTALTYLEQSLSIARKTNDETGEEVILNNIGLTHKAQGNYEMALSYFQQSLKIKQKNGSLGGTAISFNNIGQVYRVQGDYEKALSFFQRGLDIQQKIGDRYGEGTTLNNIGQIYNAWGDYKAALTYLEKSLIIRQKIGDRDGRAIALHNMGAIYLGPLQDVKKALTLFWPAYILFKQLGSPKAEATAQYVEDINRQIGETRFQEIIHSIEDQQEPSSDLVT
ncbi:MAG: tetratricopeptide repeat protein [Bacteroidetes bacterium]|nr:tetratricopeptide repeat protein [Fibrella sp.]